MEGNEMRMEIIDQLSLAGLVPVIKIDDANNAVPLCRALLDGGLPVAEITFRCGRPQSVAKPEVCQRAERKPRQPENSTIFRAVA